MFFSVFENVKQYAVFWILVADFYNEVEKAKSVRVRDQGLQQAETLSNTQVSEKHQKQRTETVQGATVHHRQQVWGVVMPVTEKERTFKYLTSIYIWYREHF